MRVHNVAKIEELPPVIQHSFLRPIPLVRSAVLLLEKQIEIKIEGPVPAHPDHVLNRMAARALG
jgi:hypothetical protein